jgi:hypothetical protein
MKRLMIFLLQEISQRGNVAAPGLLPEAAARKKNQKLA